MKLTHIHLAVFVASAILLASCEQKTTTSPAMEAASNNTSQAAANTQAPVTETSTDNAVPATQMAIVLEGNGSAEVLQYKNIPVLEPGADEVLIKVVATAINPIERRIREGGGAPPRGGAGGMGAGGMGGGMAAGGMGAPGGAAGPSVPGGDVAGIVAKTGANVTNLKVGDAVFAKIAFGETRLNGTYAEYTLAPANQTFPKPADQTFAEASGLGTVGVTALRTIWHTDVSSGQRVFINGIGGGIGSSAAQFALERGAYVLGTASAKHHDYLKSIGVNEVINYREVQFDEVITEPVDVVIETVGTNTANQALNILKPGGKLVSIAGPADASLCEEKSVDCSRIGGEFGWPNSEMLAEISRLADQGAYRLNVDSTFPLEQAGAAQDLNFTTGTTGKVVLIVDPELAFEQ